MNERYTPEDYETLRKTEFVFKERMQYVEIEKARLYTTERAQLVLDEIKAEAIEARREVYVALGLELPEILY